MGGGSCVLVRALALSFGATDAAAIRSARLFFGTQKIGVVLSYEEPHVTVLNARKDAMRRVQPRQRSNMNRQLTKQFISNSLQFICFPAILYNFLSQ